MTKELTQEEMDQMDRQARQACSVLDRIGKVMDVFNKFSRMTFKLRGGMYDDDSSLREIFEGFGLTQAEWVLQETRETINEMQAWQSEMYRRFPELKRNGLREVR
jgi:hypothetical protein